MNTVTVHHPAPGETRSFTVFSKPMGQMQFYSAETGDRGGAIIVTREEALAMAAAFAELAKDIEDIEDIEGIEGIAALGRRDVV